MVPGKRKHEDDQTDAPPLFAATLATAVANYRGREGHETAKLKASIPGIIEDQWEEWKPKVVAYAAAGKDLCWFRLRFLCFTHYVPTIEDVKEGLPEDLRQMQEDGQLKITHTAHDHPNQFDINLDYSGLAGANFREMEAAQAWPAETAETRESIKECRQVWNEEDRKREVRIAALWSKGWVKRFYENGEVHYTNEDDERETREWPDEVPKPSFDKASTPTPTPALPAAEAEAAVNAEAAVKEEAAPSKREALRRALLAMVPQVNELEQKRELMRCARVLRGL